MSKLKQIKIPVELHTVENKWRLIRTRDDLTKESPAIGFVEWNEDGTFKDLHKGIEGLGVGRSLLMSPFNRSFTWQTTEVVDFHETDDGLEFNTNNSEYRLIDLTKQR